MQYPVQKINKKFIYCSKYDILSVKMNGKIIGFYIQVD